MKIWVFPRSGFLDMRKMPPDILQDFNFQILKFGKVYIFEKCRQFRLRIVIFTGFKAPRAVRLVVACLRRFGDLRKNTPWNFGACILWILSIFVDFGVPKWYRHRMTPTRQQPPCPTATSKHPAQGSNIPFRGNPSL